MNVCFRPKADIGLARRGAVAWFDCCKGSLPGIDADGLERPFYLAHNPFQAPGDIAIRSIHRIAFALAAIAVTAGCSTHVQSPENVLASHTIARQSLLACGTAVYSEPRFALIAGHIPFNPDNTSVSQLSDDKLATQREVDLLFVFDAAFAVCPKAFLEQLKLVAPAIVEVVAEGYTKSEINTADLIGQKITWGNYATRRKSDYDDTVRKLNDELIRVRLGLDENDHSALTGRQSESNAPRAYYKSLEMIRAMNRPV